MKKILALMTIVMGAMFFIPNVANAAAPATVTEVPQVEKAQAETVVVIIETDDAIIIIVIN